VFGVLTVWLLMAAVRRPFGRTAGLVAGVALALTPIMLAVSRSNNPDVLLVLCCVGSAWAAQRAMDESPLGWMLLAGLLGGLGFLAKSLVVGAVLPAVWLGFLVGGPRPWRRRVVCALAGALVFVAVSGAWMGAVDLTPLSSRPWIGGSTDGSAQSLVFGYDGVGRVNGSGPGQVGKLAKGSFFTNAHGINEFGGTTGIGRLFNRSIGDQAMWLTPIAAAVFLGAIALALRRRRRDSQLGSAVMWGVWGVTTYVTLAFAGGTFHNYYVVVLSPAVAALVGAGVRLTADGGWVARIVAAVTLTAAAIVEVVLLDRVDAWTDLRRLVPVGVVIVAAAVLVDASGRAARRPAAQSALLAGLAVLLVAPGIWTLSGVRQPQDAAFPDARPDAYVGLPGALQFVLGGTRLPPAELTWLESQHTHERWIVAVGDASQAELNILDGHSVVALGGFLGTDKSDTVSRLAAVVADGRLRFVIIGGGMPGSGAATNGAVAKACTLVPPSTWSGGPGIGSPLYDCKGKAVALRAAGGPAG
jgi:4-amino-4-deoxy-L-arabinose transferase-like glycosyltransferase